jgi:hypothetical protein
MQHANPNEPPASDQLVDDEKHKRYIQNIQ